MQQSWLDLLSIGQPGCECGQSEQMDTFADREGEGSGLELVHVSDVLDYLGDWREIV